jgi:hypothetical protein
MPEPKTRPTPEPVQEFLARIPEERRQDCQVVLDLMREATGADPVMWGTSIVGFGRYRYRYNSGREGEWPIIGFSPRKNDLTLYLMDGFAGRDELLERLGKHKTGKSCLYLKRLSQVDLAVLRELIFQSVRAMADRRVDG